MDGNQTGTQATGLATEPVTPNTKKKTTAGKKKVISRAVPTAGKNKVISRAVPTNGAGVKSFQDGQAVLFNVKHLHGLHGQIVMKAGDNQYVVRGGEEAIEGQLFQFSADELVDAADFDLKAHHSERGLDWNYQD